MSETRWYQITPADSWFFGDSRPANAGEDQLDLQSLFPPHPQTVVGSIRAALARRLGWHHGEWDERVKAQLGNGFDDVSPLRFAPPMLAIERETESPGRGLQLLYTPPKHLLGEVKVGSEGTGVPQSVFYPRDWLRPSTKRFITDMGEVHLPLFPEQTDDADPKRLRTADEFYITTVGMQSVLVGDKPNPKELIHRSRLFAIENRIGIDRNPEKRSMYSPGHVRLADGVSLVTGVDGLDDELELPAVFPFGGESRQAVCQRLRQAPTLPQSQPGVCVVLVTPARWEDCWHGARPGGSASGLHESLASTVTTCTIERPTRIGGFDSRTKTSQTLQAYTPAGSVWWLDKPASPPEDGRWLALGERTTLGYGAALLGRNPLG